MIGNAPADAEKSETFGPLTAQLVITRFAVPVLVMITLDGELLLPTSTLP